MPDSAVQVCGFGCQLHHVAYCMMVAYGSGRTLVLNSRNWRYNRAGWEQVFQPLSDTCRDPGGRSRAAWPGKDGCERPDRWRITPCRQAETLERVNPEQIQYFSRPWVS